MIARRPRGMSRQRAVKSARQARLGLRHPAGTKNRDRTSSVSADAARPRRRLDLTQVLTLGAVLATLALAVPQYMSTRSQAHNLEQQQITERFSKAVDQLGTRDSLEVRIGGIYALERLARDSRSDHPTVVSVLAAFVRENTKALRNAGSNCPDQAVPADVQAALTVLSRRTTDWDVPKSTIELAYSCLQGADLTDAHLFRANLTNADLTMTNLRGADLTNANVSEVTGRTREELARIRDGAFGVVVIPPEWLPR